MFKFRIVSNFFPFVISDFEVCDITGIIFAANVFVVVSMALDKRTYNVPIT